VRDLGTVDGEAQFRNLGGASPLLGGTFRLSRVTVDDMPLRQVSARVSFSSGVLQLQEGRAQSSEGPLRLQARYDTRSGASTLGLNAPRVLVEANRVNPFLRSLGVRLEGTARGRLDIATGTSRVGLAPVSASFDLTLPRAVMRSVVANGSTLSLDGARLRGQGVLQTRRGGQAFEGRIEITQRALM
jgi:hypothetical protein